MKTCNHSGCVNPRFGGGFCKWHQSEREDKQVKPIPKRSERIKMAEISFGYETQWDMFMDLWSQAKDVNARVICPYTGESLNRFYRTDKFWSCFAHQLCKKNYPYWKLNPSNVKVVLPLFHTIIDQGTLAERKRYPDWKWDLWDSEVIQAKEDYLKFKKEHLLP